jgi:hypothetical protein
LLLLKCVNVNIYKMFFKFLHYAYMYRMYDVFLFCVLVVVDVDNFSVLCFFSVTSRGGLLLVHYYVVPTPTPV